MKRPITARGFDAIATWVDRLSRKMRFIACKDTDKAQDVALSFFTQIFRHHGFQIL